MRSIFADGVEIRFYPDAYEPNATQAAAKPVSANGSLINLTLFTDTDGRRMLGSMEVIRNEPSCHTASCHVHSPSQTVLGVLDIVYPLDAIEAKPLHEPHGSDEPNQGWLRSGTKPHEPKGARRPIIEASRGEGGPESILRLPTNVQHAGSLWREQPLVRAHDVSIAAERFHVHADLPDGLRAIADVKASSGPSPSYSGPISRPRISSRKPRLVLD